MRFYGPQLMRITPVKCLYLCVKLGLGPYYDAICFQVILSLDVLRGPSGCAVAVEMQKNKCLIMGVQNVVTRVHRSLPFKLSCQSSRIKSQR